MLKPEIVIIRHFSRTYLAAHHVSGVTLMAKPVNFRAWSSHNDSASESGPEEADPASASTGLDAGLLQKGGIDPLCFLCLPGNEPHTQQLVSHGCLGVHAV